MPTHYEILGVETDASPDQIKKAYRKLVRTSHPDKFVNKPEHDSKTAEFQRLKLAYETLSDPQERAFYDREGDQGPAGGVPAPTQEMTGTLHVELNIVSVAGGTTEKITQKWDHPYSDRIGSIEARDPMKYQLQNISIEKLIEKVHEKFNHLFNNYDIKFSFSESGAPDTTEMRSDEKRLRQAQTDPRRFDPDVAPREFFTLCNRLGLGGGDLVITVEITSNASEGDMVVVGTDMLRLVEKNETFFEQVERITSRYINLIEHREYISTNKRVVPYAHQTTPILNDINNELLGQLTGIANGIGIKGILVAAEEEDNLSNMILTPSLFQELENGEGITGSGIAQKLKEQIDAMWTVNEWTGDLPKYNQEYNLPKEEESREVREARAARAREQREDEAVKGRIEYLIGFVTRAIPKKEFDWAEVQLNEADEVISEHSGKFPKLLDQLSRLRGELVAANIAHKDELAEATAEEAAKKLAEEEEARAVKLQKEKDIKAREIKKEKDVKSKQAIVTQLQAQVNEFKKEEGVLKVKIESLAKLKANDQTEWDSLNKEHSALIKSSHKPDEDRMKILQRDRHQKEQNQKEFGEKHWELREKEKQVADERLKTKSLLTQAGFDLKKAQDVDPEEEPEPEPESDLPSEPEPDLPSEPEPVGQEALHQTTPEQQGRYKALRGGIIRETSAIDSAKVGNLKVGEEFPALETVKLESGQLRVRMERGWVSVISGKNEIPILEKIQGGGASLPDASALKWNKSKKKHRRSKRKSRGRSKKHKSKHKSKKNKSKTRRRRRR